MIATKTHTTIEKDISAKKKGTLFFISDFLGKGTHAAIKKSLARMVDKGLLRRLAHGIYYVPRVDPKLGELLPGPEEVVKMIAHKEKIRIKPAGAYALHKLGLTTQVPTRMVYITDGPPRQLKMGKLEIKFKATTPKKLSTKGTISGLIMQALEETGTQNLDAATEKRIKALLETENPQHLEHDLKLFPARINDYIVRLLKSGRDDRMVNTQYEAEKGRY